MSPTCSRIAGVYILRAVLLMILLSTLPATTARAQTVEQPNILWIIAEDLSPDLGLLDTAEARTPNLDGLAERGMLFTRAFTPSPVCSPSRSALVTGMYPQAIGAQNHRSHRPGDPSPAPWPLPDSVRTVMDWLRHAGYYTANVVRFPEGAEVVGQPLKGAGKRDWNFTYRGQPFDTNRWSDLKDHQPFYAQVNFSETHRGHAWQEAQETVRRPADPARVELPPYYPDHPVARREWAEYLNTLQVLDEKVGAVLGQLEADGLAKNTVVVFLSDHGRAMVRAKQWPYDSGLRIPLIVYWPEGLAPPAPYAAGTRSAQLVSTLDLTTTTMAVAGVPHPEEKTQGRVLFGTEAGPERLYVFGGRDRGDETVDRMRTVRTGRFRYIRNAYPGRPYLQTNRYKQANYPMLWLLRKLDQEGRLNAVQERFLADTRPKEELYDHAHDPYETVNLADSAAYQEVLRQLRRTLDQWVDVIGPVEDEDPAVAAYYEEKMRQLYEERIEALREEWGVEP